MTRNLKGILFVNHQIYNEATRVLHNKGRFVFEVFPDKIDFLNTRQRRINEPEINGKQRNQHVGLGCIIDHGININKIQHLVVELNWSSAIELNAFFSLISNIRYVSHTILQFPSRRSITITCREWPFLTRHPAGSFLDVFRTKIGIFTVMWILFERITLRDEGHVNLVVDLGMALRGTDPDLGVETPVVPVVQYMKGLQKATARGIQQGQFGSNGLFLRMAHMVVAFEKALNFTES